MNEIVLHTQVRTELAIRSAIETVVERFRDEEGQTSIEYVGIIAVVALLLAGLLAGATGWGQNLATKVGSVVTKVTS
jgi:Flp pilus assembly pilin Flp